MAQLNDSAGRPSQLIPLASRIRWGMRTGLLITIAAASVAVAGGLWAYHETDQAYSGILSETAAAQEHSLRLNDALVAEVLHTRAYLITGDEQSVTSRSLAHEAFEREYEGLRGQFEQQGGEALAALDNLMALHGEYDAFAEEMVSLRRAGQAEAAVRLFNQRSDPVVFELLAARHELQNALDASLAQANSQVSATTIRLLAAVTVLFLLGAVLSGWLMTRLLTPSLRDLDYLEAALVESVQAESLNPVRLPQSVADQPTAIFQAYNTLVTRLKEGDAYRLHFLSTVGHNLRSPLASILGYAELLHNPALRPDDADPASYGRIISKQGQRIMRVVDRLISAAQIGEHRLELALTPMRLSPLIAEIVAEARQQSQRDIRVEDDLGAALVLGDGLHLREALANLIDNALKFSPSDAPVEVQLRRAAHTGWAEIRVRDYGIGIAESERALLFQRFGRVNTPEARNMAGSGLGLYITKHVIDGHRGRIDLTSQPGQGTTVIVRLPLEETYREFEDVIY